MVNNSIFIVIKTLNVSMKKNFHKRKQQGEQKPIVNHLDIRGLGQAAGHADEHGDKHQHAGQVHCYHSFKEEGFEVVCNVYNDEDENGGEICC